MTVWAVAAVCDVGQERGMHGPLRGAAGLGRLCQGGVPIWAG